MPETKLRDYQQRAIDELYAWFQAGNAGNPCIVMPTGSGKSHVIAALCRDAITSWPETRILMLTHVRELIVQNAEKMREHWPAAPLGIYSAGLGVKTLGEPITFGGIQSLRNKAADIGAVDLIIVDECHLISHKNEGGYRKLIAGLKAANPNVRVIGLTATPWRLGHGTIIDGDALFDALIDPVTIEELIYKGHLAPLRSKHTDTTLSVDGVGKRGGEYIESELQAAVNHEGLNEKIVGEISARSGDRLHWLIFCTGVMHATAIRDKLRDEGVTAETILGSTPKGRRDEILHDFKSGKITAITNANVLTTGFDYPDIDLIALLRPTASPTLYCQMAGRGMRPKSHVDDCLVLDFAGIVAAHGPITHVEPPAKKGKGESVIPAKKCPECGELIHISVMICPACGHSFPPPEEKKLVLRNDDIMGFDALEMNISEWVWRKHVSRASGKEMIKVTYYGGLTDPPITEYFPILHGGYAESKARLSLRKMGIQMPMTNDIVEIAHHIQNGGTEPPESIRYRREGRFYKVLR